MTSKKGRSQTYVLNGEPQALFLRRSDDIVGWNNHKEKKLIADITLVSQHDEAPLFTGKLVVDIVFYFQTPNSPRCKIKAKEGDRHFVLPTIFRLINFLEDTAQNVVFANTASITELTSKKLYADVPRTEFTVTEIV